MHFQLTVYRLRFLVFESRQPASLVISVRRRRVAQLERFAADLLVRLDLRELGDVVRSPKGSALVAVAAFRIRHGWGAGWLGRLGRWVSNRQIVNSVRYFFSRWRVCFRSLGLYFMISSRSVVFRLFLV